MKVFLLVDENFTINIVLTLTRLLKVPLEKLVSWGSIEKLIENSLAAIQNDIPISNEMARKIFVMHEIRGKRKRDFELSSTDF